MNRHLDNEKALPPRCEECELDLSALLDGELGDEALLPALDHLAECPGCREFYRRARQLEAAVAERETGEQKTGGPPAEIWRRIAAESGLERKPAWPAWAGRIAASLLLAFGVWTLATLPERPAERGATIEIVLGEDQGSMSEKRFAELTAEVLRADPRYQRKMLEVMATIAEFRESQGEAPNEGVRGSGERPSWPSGTEGEGRGLDGGPTL